jgi:acetyltransferase
VIAVENRAVSAALEVAATLKARAVIVMCDRSDAADALRWAQFAQRARMRLLGPGAMGIVRPGLKLNAGRMGPLPAEGGVALVSQSGVLGGSILDWAAGTAIGFSLAVSLGAEADIDVAQVLDFLASDPRTKSVVVYLEVVRDARSFMSALRALAAVKPVVVLKGNRDGAPRRRALTHSGAIVGSDAIYSAALRRAGAVQVRLFTQLFTAARILASSRAVLGTRLAVLGNGNAPGVLVADMALWAPVRLPAPSAETVEALREKLPAVIAENPLNLGVGARPADYAAAIEVLSADREFDGVMVTLAAYTGVDAAGVTDAVIAASKNSRKPLFACWMGDRSVRGLWRALDDAGIPVFRTPEAAVDAYATVAVFTRTSCCCSRLRARCRGSSRRTSKARGC